ncbi:MAG: hypothetical protein AAF384_17035 [Pseudomonadota bacterium]
MYFKRLIATGMLMLMAASTNAQTLLIDWTYLSDPTFFDTAPGADFRFATIDDVAVPGLNPQGHLSYLEDTIIGVSSGFAGGTLSTKLNTLTGTYDITAVSSSGTFNCPAFFCGALFDNAPASFVLSNFLPGAVNGGAFVGTNTFTLSFDTVSSFSDFGRWSGTGYSWLRGEDLNLLPIPPGVIAHFNAISGLLPGNWSGVALLDVNTSVLSGPNLGYQARQVSTVFYTNTDVTVIPIPATLPLLVSALGLLIARRQSRA